MRTAPARPLARTDTHHGHFVKLRPDEKVVQAIIFETADPAMLGTMTATCMARLASLAECP
ncbi:MAG: hypothetical protein ABJC74_01505 [Gemmatimonadota bacterium]